MENERFQELVLEQLQRLSLDLSEFKKDVHLRFDKVEQRLDKVEQRLDKVEQRLDKVEQRLDKVEQRLDKVEQRLDNVENRLIQIVEIVSDHTASLKVIKIALVAIEKRLLHHEEDITELKEAL